MGAPPEHAGPGGSVLDCGSHLPLFRPGRMGTRQRAGAVRDLAAAPRFPGTLHGQGDSRTPCCAAGTFGEQQRRPAKAATPSNLRRRSPNAGARSQVPSPEVAPRRTTMAFYNPRPRTVSVVGRTSASRHHSIPTQLVTTGAMVLAPVDPRLRRGTNCPLPLMVDGSPIRLHPMGVATCRSPLATCYRGCRLDAARQER